MCVTSRQKLRFVILLNEEGESRCAFINLFLKIRRKKHIFDAFQTTSRQVNSRPLSIPLIKSQISTHRFPVGKKWKSRERKTYSSALMSSLKAPVEEVGDGFSKKKRRRHCQTRRMMIKAASSHLPPTLRERDSAVGSTALAGKILHQFFFFFFSRRVGKSPPEVANV